MAVTQSAKQRVPAALLSAVAFIIGFVPWIIYWILVGNAPFLTAVLAGLGFAVAINVSTLVRRQPLMVLEAGTAVVFAGFRASLAIDNHGHSRRQGHARGSRSGCAHLVHEFRLAGGDA